MNRKLVFIYLGGEFIGLAVTGVVMFWSAGRLDWGSAWAVIIVWLIWFITVDSVILRVNPDLIRERLSPPNDAKTWDKTILSIIRLIELGRYILAGLDIRYGWTSGFPLTAQILAFVICVPGTALFAWAIGSNSYFSQVVRIQADRGHVVATGGPYRYVRHPGYTAMILFEVSLSILLASWWAILAGGVCAVLFILRTTLEDHTLQTELAGYKEYAQQVRYRLIPGMW